ncbi:MAG: kch [Chitinophagaceae bacterium]|nr:kch [Chitinophagaceae bacterium]
MKSLKKKVFAILETNTHKYFLGRFVRILIVGLILLNVFAVIIETIASIQVAYGTLFDIIELGSAIIFAIEYILRVWVCNLRRQFKGPWGRLRYMVTPMALIDFLSIFPFLFLLIGRLDFRVLMLIRFFRLLRIFKLRRYSHALETLVSIIRAKKEELIITFATIFVLLIVASSLMYILEHEAQPEVFSSIPATMWWGVATLSTVSYGDMVPMTVLGKLLGSCIAIMGVAMFAIPAGLISAGFNQRMILNKQQKTGINEEIICPHCHQTFHHRH